jgi:hypothetical protein
MEEMDVEGITQVLQGRSRHRESDVSSSSEPSISSNAPHQLIPPIVTPTLPTLRASGDLQLNLEAHAPTTSDADASELSATGNMVESSLSWVEQFTATSSNGARSPSMVEAQLSDSMISGSLSTTSEVVSDKLTSLTSYLFIWSDFSSLI